ncbi:aluminum-activated malate transporter 2-like isoform X1 [Castanea sativa]|uniref:aluminum-activated malate transporter 2-like isoform X1 n=1 Tax=Castanea sativa TaxID=21020 RepID=UPI003F64C142
MEMASEIKNGVFVHNWEWFKALSGKLGTKIVETARKIKKLGQDDPRRIIHSLKFGLALTLVSLIYYFEPLYKGFGNSAMYAILTVIVVFEFSVGATLGRGLNRGLATLVAGALGFGAHYLASLAGEEGEPILLGLFVFLLAGVVTFVRFFPQLKARYDYGLLIFMLTFCLVSISGYREDEILEIAHQRLSTILIGSSTSVFICLFVFPVWAGDDLHNLVASNLEKLGSFLESFGVEYLKISGDSKESNNTFMDDYKSVLNSKQSEECLANLARWEPRHGQFRFRHPWKQYLKIGSLTRQCAYRIEALNGYVNSEIQIPAEFRSKIQEACTNMSLESGKALKELASAIKAMTPPSSVTPHIVKSKDAANNLKSLLRSGFCKEIDLLEVIPAVTVASLLVDVVCCTEKIAESINELASLAHFQSVEPMVEAEKPKLLHQETIPPCFGVNEPHHVITIDQLSPKLP